MVKAFFSFCILFAAVFLSAAQPVKDPLQARFDKLAAGKTLGPDELNELRAIMEAEKDSGKKIDCSFCPDAFTWDVVLGGYFPEAGFLFDRHADFGIRDEDDTTLLQALCRKGDKKFAEYLIGLGAEIDLPDKEGRSAIHYAAMSGDPDMVKMLLDLGSNPNKLSKKKDTPLHFAAKYAGLEEVRFLVEHGASIKAINWNLIENLKEQLRRQDKIYYDSDEEHILALKIALGLKTPESMESDEDEEEIEEDEDDDGGERYVDTMDEDTPQVKKKDTRTITDPNKIPFELLPRDINDAANVDGITVLHYAVAKGDVAVAQYLVDNGADIMAQDNVLSRSAIHFAAESGSLECIKFLAEKGADILDRDTYGATALHYAARSGNLDIVKYLVDKKLDYKAKDFRGWTAMHYAAYGGNIDMVRYLLGKGLNINAQNDSGRTPFFFAKKRELRVYMSSRGAK